MVCAPQAGDDNIGVTLERSYFELGELDWTDAVKDPGGIEFNLPISEWMALFREIGFEIDNYVEVKAPDSAEGTQFWMPADWSKNYPSEQVWWLRRSQRLQLRSSGTGAA